MIYKKLGKTGLNVSSLCFGAMTFGDGASEAESREIYALARDSGVNLFDCADVYSRGEAERILGRLIQGHRNDVILTSKAYYPMSGDTNNRGLSRRHLTLSLDNSLKRLGTDYIDIYFLHSFDPDTPLEESLAALNDFIRQGKILYAGVSNFAAWQVMKAIGLSRSLGSLGIHCIQPMYNVLKRQAEAELLPLAAHENLGVLTYGPLAGGFLTGKYLAGRPETARFNDSEMYQKRYRDGWIQDAVVGFVDLARRYQTDPIHLAISWAASHPSVTAPLIGARSQAQLRHCLCALETDLTPEICAEIDKLSPPPALATDRSEEK